MNPSLLPVGYTFCPTDEELLTFYLYHKIMGDFIPPIMLPVIDIYTQEPPQIWEQCGGVEGRDVHFFTTLKKRKSRIIRKVGSNGAMWSGESKATKVFSHDNTLVGTFKRFHYENSKMTKVDDCNNIYSWIMYEYTLQPNLVPQGVIHDSFVLCMLRKKILKQHKRAPCTRKEHLIPKRKRVEGQISIDRVENECFVNTRQFSELLLNGCDLEEQSQLLFQESGHQPLMINYSGETGSNNRQYHNDMGLISECQPMQMKPWLKDMTFREICPTMEMMNPDQNCSIQDEDALFAKEIEMAFEQQCNDDVALSYKENDSNHDNENY
ncbi:NAC domain-containing protein 105-like protein [Cucumis melo var. makuwa]|uniref:NAC domain-containing protein 105-like protein n=2 Tax=Cucumis melo TaxID=3656 RepID=A0A5D3BHG6_CUCMM|nr:NAC domain-containing protein 105-like protein [Cucumis melo var. makuwa]